MTNNGLLIENVSVSYDGGKTKTIENVSLFVPSGKVLAIIGPSGSGKSTLLRAVAGIEKVIDGGVYLDGEKLFPKTKKIGFAPQNYGLLPWKTVEENIMLAARIKKEDTLDCLQKMNELMESLGILEFRKKFPLELSGGQQQRVSLARAFLPKLDILLMDEPFSALDAITREVTQDIFLKLWEKHKITTLFVTHDVGEALYLGEKIAVFSGEAKILKELDNPFFGSREHGDNEEFFNMRTKIRELIQKAKNW